jgi:predicted ester cyclase
MGTEGDKEAIRTALEALNQGDWATYGQLYDPALIAYGYGPEPLDFAGLMGFYETVGAGFSDISVTADQLLAEGDSVAARYTFRCTHTGEFMGVAATGRRVEVPGQTILRFRDGKVVERWQSLDAMSLMMQLGAIPAPATA